MAKENRIQLFDDWAEHYDRVVQAEEGFPLAGYEQVLNEIVRIAAAQPGMTILDLGIGTGNLATRFVQLGCSLWGLDFSPEMLKKAAEKLPQATLVRADLLGDWPAELQRRFDRIVSAYVFHEFDLTNKVGLLQRLAQYYLAEGGRMVIGDVAFPAVEVRQAASEKWVTLWDEEEHYWAADETVEACASAGLCVTYKQVSICGGVFSIEPIIWG